MSSCLEISAEESMTINGREAWRRRMNSSDLQRRAKLNVLHLFATVPCNRPPASGKPSPFYPYELASWPGSAAKFVLMWAKFQGL